MKKSNILIAASVMIFIALLIYFSRSDTSKSNAQNHQPHAPAIPQKQTPEKSGMEQEESEPQTVEISPEKQQLIGVKTATVEVKPLRKVIRTVGRIEYDETRLKTVNTKYEGWIEKLYADYTGRYVSKGDPLFEVYSPELLATQQEFINALKSNESLKIQNTKTDFGKLLSTDSRTIIEAARQRLRLWDISEEQINKIEHTGKPVRTMTVYSPVNGYIAEKMALQGMRVMPGEKLYDIADLSRVWVLSDIYEYELPLIKTGQSAKISLSYFPGREFISRVEYIYPTISPETRTAKVRFVLPNPGGKLKPKMFTDVEIKIGLGKKLAVPEAAIIDTGKRKIVYVDKGEGYFEPREIMTGAGGEGYIEVTMGLKAGDKVASSATFLIDSEAQLKGVKPLTHQH
jgi:membrane fusion protein, copper/silver efflux system